MFTIKDFRNTDLSGIMYNENGQKILVLATGKNHQNMVVEDPTCEKRFVFQVWGLKGEEYRATHVQVQKAYKGFKGAYNHLIRVTNMYPND